MLRVSTRPPLSLAPHELAIGTIHTPQVSFFPRPFERRPGGGVTL